MAQKKKKLLKSQRALLINRNTELTESRLSIMKDIERRDNEIVMNILAGYASELGLDVENETWIYDDKESAFVKKEDPPKVKETTVKDRKKK